MQFLFSFFFSSRRRHTRSLRDWSSDVCSSDLTAERLFREIGYQKTTVADIARALRMSPANVYRFFDSKKSINEGVARILMSEVEHASQVIATRPRGATERLRELLETVHRMNSD